MINTEKIDSVIKETLKSICCSNGWCYGLFWGFDQTNSLLLTLKDAYFEEQMRSLVDNVLHQVHNLGRGLIGQVALSQKNRWIYSDSADQEIPDHLFGHSQDEFEFFNHFNLGIKTIVLISVEPWGVLQFGSTEKVPEKIEFVDQVREKFNEKKTAQELISDSQMINSSTHLGSLLSHDMHHFRHDPEYEHLIVPSYPSSVTAHGQYWSKLTNEFEQLLFESSSFFDMPGSQILTSVNTYGSFEQSSSNIQSYPSSLLVPTHYKDSKPTGLLTLDELFQENDFSEANITRSCLVNDDVSEWSSQEHSNGLIPLPNMSGRNTPMCASDSIITNSKQSSTITDTFGSKTSHEKFSSPSGTGKTLKRSEVDPECTNSTGQNDPVLNFRTYLSRTSNSLFSKLGLDEILDGIASYGPGSCMKTGYEDQWSKRRKIDNYSWNQSKEKVQNNPVYDLETRNIAEIKSEASTKEQGSFIGDMCTEKTNSSRRQEEMSKTGKKKAKPGTKPRPKDRQMIQDRLAELRQLLPNGEKMSIDRLLERTIRHLNYMQSLTKHAEILKLVDKPKAEVSRKDSYNNGGVTWAYEVGDPTMVCPLVVEDLTTQGQMLIEILCEEQGFFLEIVDIIRSFGLIVLKGTMEIRETKIWARFIVEAEGNRRITRHEIFSSLIQLLQMGVKNAADSNDHIGGNNKIISSEAFLFNKYQPSISYPAVNMVNPLHCASVRQCS